MLRLEARHTCCGEQRTHGLSETIWNFTGKRLGTQNLEDKSGEAWNIMEWQVYDQILSLQLQRYARCSYRLSLQVEVVICDIPFGRQYGTIQGCRDTLYKAAVSC